MSDIQGAGDWLAAAEMACNDALAGLGGVATPEQLLAVAQTHALIDQARTLRAVHNLIVATGPDDI